MSKFNFKLFLVVFISLFPYYHIFSQKQICKCKLVDNYIFSDYSDKFETKLSSIYDAMVNIKDGVYQITSKEKQEAVFNNMLLPLEEILPPYSIKYEDKLLGYGIPNWVDDIDDTKYSVILKKPFNTYIEEQKNFDVFSAIAGSYLTPVLVVKNYFTNSEYQSLGVPKLIIDDVEFDFPGSLAYLGNKYKEQNLAIKNGPSTIAYRTVRIFELPISFSILSHKGIVNNLKSHELYIASLIEKVKPGKVSLVYETSTGQIKRMFNEAQVKSLKEMLQIYYNLQFDKFTVTYLNEQVKKECEEMEAQIAKDNEEHYKRLKPIEDKIKEVMEKYKKF